MVVLALYGEVTKALFVYVDDVVGLELFATTLADKHMATVLPKFVLVRR